MTFSPVIRRLNAAIAVAPQIAVDDVGAIKAAGFRTLINNRPDGEAPDQPAGAAIAAAARAAGLGYHAIPVGPAGIGPEQREAMAAALTAAGADGPVLAFCRSGTRSCHLWALAAAQGGADPATLIAAASTAGYDLQPLAPTLIALAGAR